MNDPLWFWPAVFLGLWLAGAGIWLVIWVAIVEIGLAARRRREAREP